MLTALALSVLFLVTGIVFSMGKGASLIAGYNTASQLKKDSIDAVALCKSLGKGMFVFSFSQLLLAMGIYFDLGWLRNISIGIIILGAIFIVVYMNLRERKNNS